VEIGRSDNLQAQHFSTISGGVGHIGIVRMLHAAAADSHFVRVSSIVDPLYDDGCFESNLPDDQSDFTAQSYT